MSEKLKECVNNLLDGLWYTLSLCNPVNGGKMMKLEYQGYEDSFYRLKAESEKLLSIPKHETVEQWEERTGETYPDDGPVWHKIKRFGKFEFVVSEYSLYKKWKFDLDDPVVIVANHHGKPT